MSFAVQEALMHGLPDSRLEEMSLQEDFEMALTARRILKYRKERSRSKNATHRLDYPIEEVFDDYVNRRTGKLVEAKRQLRRRFDGLDHDMQEKVMFAFMESDSLNERNFIYDKLYGEDFWTDDYIPLVQQWWERFQDFKMAKVVAKRCPREYILRHIDVLGQICNHATLCLRCGIDPDPEKLTPWTYLYVVKTIGGQLRFHEGEEAVMKQVRAYLYEEGAEKPVYSLYDIPYVRRMMAYIGEMGLVDDLMAINDFEKRTRAFSRKGWGNAVIEAIEEEYAFPPYVFKNVK